jgi:hypothetical protein
MNFVVLKNLLERHQCTIDLKMAENRQPSYLSISSTIGLILISTGPCNRRFSTNAFGIEFNGNFTLLGGWKIEYQCKFARNQHSQRKSL